MRLEGYNSMSILNLKSINFKTFAILLILLGVFFVFTSVEAADPSELRCCVMWHSAPGDDVRIGVGSQPVACRQETEDNHCDESPISICDPDGDGISDWIGTDGDNTRVCPGGETKRMEVTRPCSNPQCVEKFQVELQKSCADLGKDSCDGAKDKCVWVNRACHSRFNGSLCTSIRGPDRKICEVQMSSVCQWLDNRCRTKLEGDLTKDYKEGGLVTGCGVRGTCRDINDIIVLILNYTKRVFSLIGVLGFIMFIYGGMRMILSFGNPESFKTGQKALVYAVVGIIIAFSAYMLINFLLTALGVDPAFRAII